MALPQGAPRAQLLSCAVYSPLALRFRIITATVWAAVILPAPALELSATHPVPPPATPQLLQELLMDRLMVSVLEASVPQTFSIVYFQLGCHGQSSARVIVPGDPTIHHVYNMLIPRPVLAV